MQPVSAAAESRTDAAASAAAASGGEQNLQNGCSGIVSAAMRLLQPGFPQASDFMESETETSLFRHVKIEAGLNEAACLEN